MANGLQTERSSNACHRKREKDRSHSILQVRLLFLDYHGEAHRTFCCTTAWASALESDFLALRALPLGNPAQSLEDNFHCGRVRAGYPGCKLPVTGPEYSLPVFFRELQ